MDTPTAIILGVDATSRHVNSARPDAPVVPHVEAPPRLRSLRLTLSRGFAWAARVTAPTECSPAR